MPPGGPASEGAGLSASPFRSLLASNEFLSSRQLSRVFTFSRQVLFLSLRLSVSAGLCLMWMLQANSPGVSPPVPVFSETARHHPGPCWLVPLSRTCTFCFFVQGSAAPAQKEPGRCRWHKAPESVSNVYLVERILIFHEDGSNFILSLGKLHFSSHHVSCVSANRAAPGL